MITCAKASIFKPKPRLYLITSNTKITIQVDVNDALQDQNCCNAMTKELDALAKNNTYCLVQPASDMKIVRNKQVFSDKTKR